MTANVDAKGAAIYPVGSLSFGEEATTETNGNVRDVVYGTSITCSECGVANDGSQFIYAVTGGNSGAATSFATSRIVYSTDGGVNWSTSEITGTIVTDVPKFIEIAGSILFIGIVASGGNTSIYYINIDPLTGGITGTWSSYTVTGSIQSVWVKSPRSIWFAGFTTGPVGTIWKSTDILATPTVIDTGTGASNLYKIHGANDTIVAVGGTAGFTVIRYTKNGGATWSTITDTTLNTFGSAGVNVDGPAKSVFVIDNNNWFVGLTATVSSKKNLIKTLTGGASWAAVTYAENIGNSVDAIVFPTREVCWLAVNTGTSGRLHTSIDGGNTFARYDVTSRISGYSASSVDTINAIGVPFTAEPAVAANYVSIVGESTVGAADLGIIISAAPTIV